MTKRKLFANNWKEYKDTPHEFFPEVPFDEYMDWRVFQWEILPSHCCIVRAYTKSGKVQEYSYKRWAAASKKIAKLLKNPDMAEVTFATDAEVQPIKISTNDDE